MKTSIILIQIIFSIIISYLVFSTSIPEEDITIKMGKISGAYEAMQFWNMVRAYPNEDISSDAYFNAYEQMQEIRLSKQFKIKSNNHWQAIGPHNTGGRTNALAFNPQNPNTIYAGSASGGLWRSYTGGVGVDAWHQVPTGFPVLGVSSITFVPNDSNTIYLGTGEVYNYSGAGHGAAYRNLRGTYGIGILKTIDGGQNWFKSLDWSYNSQRGVWAVKLNPLNPNTLFANTTEGVYRSYDAGTSWHQVNNVVMGTDIEINPVDTNIILSAHGNFASPGYGIYRSSDGGNSWNQITAGLQVSRPLLMGKFCWTSTKRIPILFMQVSYTYSIPVILQAGFVNLLIAELPGQLCQLLIILNGKVGFRTTLQLIRRILII